MRLSTIIAVMLLLLGCKQERESIAITQVSEYDRYLETSFRPTLNQLRQENLFWAKRLDSDTSGVGDIGPLAGTYQGLFELTGNIEHLHSAEKLYRKGIKIAAPQFRDGLERGLAQVLISQHRFHEAYETLLKSYSSVSSKEHTNLMLFDAAMELGYYQQAFDTLVQLKDHSDFSYLIRRSKWSDHKGNLEKAIKHMEKAKKIADEGGSLPLKIWTYSNLGDYYGHAGRISDSYEMYLATLALQPDNAYVKKAIAYIIYAAEQNPKEALRILDSVMIQHQAPDYHLFRSEILTFQGNLEAAAKERSLFIEKASLPAYGNMYTLYLIDVYAEIDPEKALRLAEAELNTRETPETYQWLAYALLKSGNIDKALTVIESNVSDKTFEPIALYHCALIYKAAGFQEKVDALKLELKESRFELGPLLFNEIEKL